ncbi:sporulation peptidase YabG [Effusibacillus lacus]|uniref:Peptidase n=1 Tax=Effusibacillus lacus TaxID=1348429 RepID=A0A292YGU3_9BACL|nr:sporulation peptidase YabG [Effusibacillus lacus]TCS74448.1 spore coat assembly protein [Effusibacillus lacus]GAX88678.1 peptidase [Effusibacillus lacus]
MWKVGDRVARKSYNKDVFFIVIDVDSTTRVAVLKGMEIRLLADAPFEDLVRVTDEEWQSYMLQHSRQEADSLRLIRMRRLVDKEKQMLRSGVKLQDSKEFYERPGRIVHLDGDGSYLNKCMLFYEELGLQAYGYHVSESRMADVLAHFLDLYHPDILVITGHDGLIRKGHDTSQIYNYRNTENFIRAVKVARKYERSLDELIIFAGACQSHYEALLEAGANFASSPKRILIHALDPVLVAEKIAYTPINQTINIYDVVQSTITGTDGLGGLESRGKYRLGLPKSPG